MACAGTPLFADNMSVQPDFDDKVVGLEGCESEVTTVFINRSLVEVDRLSYSWEAGDLKGEGDIQLSEPIAAKRGSYAYLPIRINCPAERGEHQLKVTVTSVNGEANTSDKPVATTTLISSPRVPVTRPLVDEYTGLWCGACPVGYVMMERLNQQYPDRFVGIAWHYNDAMQMAKEFPVVVKSYPNSYINRVAETAVGSIPEVWAEYCNKYVNVAMDVKLRYTDESHTELEATTDMMWVESVKNLKCNLAYVLVADGLNHPSWRQANKYSGNYSFTGPFTEPFVNGGSMVSGLTFNDVAMDQTSNKGIPGSVGKSATAFEPVEHSYRFNIGNLLESTSDATMAQTKPQYRVVAILLDSDYGEVINCAASGYPLEWDESGIGEIIAEEGEIGEGEIIEESYFDISGRRLSGAPEKGIFLKQTRYASGKTTTQKRLK